MKVSCHGGHSAEFCDHATPGFSTADLVQAYYQNGFRHVAITEHRPPPDDKFLYPDEIQMGHDASFLSDRFDRYFSEVRAELQSLWRQKMHLLFGFETEYCGEDPIRQNQVLIDRYRPDIVVASVHHVNDIPIDSSREEYDRAVSICGGLEMLYGTYYDHQFELICALPALMQGRPVVIGHADLVKLFSPDYLPPSGVWKKIDRNIGAAVESGCIFEVNARAFKKGLSDPYPGGEILRRVAARGGEVTLGDDAHAPAQVGLFYERSLPVVRKFFDSVVAFEWQESEIRKVTILFDAG